MITKVDRRFREEAERFALRFGCECCFAWNTETLRCSHEYPNEQHRGVDLQHADQVVFCKEFELG